MAIAVAAIDVWHGTDCREQSISQPHLNQIHGLLDRMDGRITGILTIETDRSRRFGMMIGGGPDLFLCSVLNLDDDTDIWNLSGDFSREHTIRLWAGGQEGDYSGHYLSGPSKVIEAIDYFFEHEARHPALTWFAQTPESY